MTPVVVIVGPPGAGKTTVAKALSRRLRLPFRDTDQDIERQVGTSVQDIFIDHGEEHFRELEVAAVRQALVEHDGVLALGGGAVLADQTRELLKSHRVVFLDVSLPAATKRVGMNSGRPLLLGNVRSQLKQLMDHRRPLYSESARFTVVTDDLTVNAVTDAVIQLIEGDP